MGLEHVKQEAGGGSLAASCLSGSIMFLGENRGPRDTLFVERELATYVIYPYDVTGSQDFWVYHYEFYL